MLAEKMRLRQPKTPLIIGVDLDIFLIQIAQKLTTILHIYDGDCKLFGWLNTAFSLYNFRLWANTLNAWHLPYC
jgi:hypothetical protein